MYYTLSTKRIVLRALLAASLLLAPAVVQAAGLAQIAHWVEGAQEERERFAWCVHQASARMDVPVPLIVAVKRVESGPSVDNPRVVNNNTNGTRDLGLMQINVDVWLPELRQRFGVEEGHLYDPCTNVLLGTWILANRISDAGSVAAGAGHYHSYTQQFATRYRKALERELHWMFGEGRLR